MSDFPCTCSHSFDQHEDNPDSVFFGFCKCPVLNYRFICCECKEYKADNLLYLESKLDGI